MFITLYKKCILTKDYNEVFDCTHRTKTENNVTIYYSHFSEYLDTLTNITYEIEDVYLTNDGVINLPLTLPNDQNFLTYNYMRLSYYATNQHTYRTTRYCFIDDIDIRNDIAVITYSTDVWHTHSAYMNIRRSYLSRSRVLSLSNLNNESLNLSPYDIPVEYDGNNKLIYSTIFQNDGYYSLFVKCQVYRTTSFGRVSERESFLGLYEDINGNYYFTPQQVTKIMQDMIILTGTNQWKSSLIGIALDGCYVELANFYLIPNSFNISKQFKDNEPQYCYYIDGIDTHGISTFHIKSLSSISTTKENIFFSKDFTIPNDFKNIKIGTFNNNINIVNNGTSIIGNVSAIFSIFDMKIYFNFENQLLDVTEDFLVELPFTSVSGEENMSLLISRSIKNVGAILSLIMGVNALSQGGSLIGSGTTSKVSSSIVKNNYSSIKDIFGSRKLTSQRKDIVSTTKSTEGNILPKLTNSIGDLVMANTPLYSSTKGSFGQVNGYFNCVLGGLFIFKVDSENDFYVNGMIDNTGYITYYLGNFNFIILDNTTITSMTTKPYNIIKCDFIDLYGDFSQNIAETLKEIILTGFKIWYSKNV